MAEVIVELSSMDLFPEDEYQKLVDRIRRDGPHKLYFQGDGIRMVRDKGFSSHINDLFIKRYTAKLLPPYILLLKDIDDAIKSYKTNLKSKY